MRIQSKNVDAVRYRVNHGKRGVTTVVYLGSGRVIVTTVKFNGEVETNCNAP